MATQKEIKEILKELNLTKADMDRFWAELPPVNSLVKRLSAQGISWVDMNASVIRNLPHQKEKDLARIEKEKEEKEAKEKAEEEERKRKQYYNDHFDEVMLEKMDKGKSLTEREVKRLIDDYGFDETEGDEGRWERYMTTYVNLKGRYFIIYWNRGLTEYQENSYLDQPYEVEKVTTIKIIPEHREEIIKWVPVSRDKE